MATECVRHLSSTEHTYLASVARSAQKNAPGLTYDQALLEAAENQISLLQQDENAILQAAFEKWQVEDTEPVITTIFEGLLPERSAEERNIAKQAMAAHPLAARMQYVEEHFYDLLLELEQNGKVDIQC
jgi:hypothetical protein